MSDTPRTDEMGDKWDEGLGMPSEILSLCRELERELNEQLLVNGKGSEREAALLAKVERLERENAALREDKERLDCGCIIVREMDEMGNFVPVLHTGINLRAAIDAARKEAKP